MTTKNDSPIDARCAEVGISRLELSRRAGISRRTIEDWCAGARRSPNAYQLYRLALTLDCPMEALLDQGLLAEEANAVAAIAEQRAEEEAARAKVEATETENE